MAHRDNRQSEKQRVGERDNRDKFRRISQDSSCPIRKAAGKWEVEESERFIRTTRDERAKQQGSSKEGHLRASPIRYDRGRGEQRNNDTQKAIVLGVIPEEIVSALAQEKDVGEIPKAEEI